jgi:murein tripeptide amidase MpaA
VLNPDGVARGNWRFDIRGENLNRKYKSTNFAKYPTILAAKEAILEENDLKMFMDFHAHMSKRGCFVYGNTLDCLE